MTWIERHEISVYHDDDSDAIILYSPLARRSASISYVRYESIKNISDAPKDLLFLVDYLPYDERPAVKNPEDYTLLTVLPNNKCNFTCSYCYSGKCRDDHTLDLNKLRACIDYFIDSKKNKPNRNKLTISFMGGGEPMLSWDIVCDGVEYAESKVHDTKIKVGYRIITNGSLIDDDKIRFIIDHNINISVSFEVLENIQNLQRRHFDIVDSNLRRLIAAGIDTQLNVTITPANVDKIIHTYETMRLRYPEITNAMFEPVTSETMFKSPDDMRDFYRKYIAGFIEIYTRGRKDGVEITSFPYLRSVYPIRRACPGEFCITADGKITGCYCVSMDSHHLFSKSCYGDFDNGILRYNEQIYNQLLSYNKDTRKECKNCIARWNCGGGCWHQFNSYSLIYQDVVCEFTREYLRQIVLTDLKLSNNERNI